MTLPFRSKLPDTGTTIFTVMSALAAEHGAINLSQGFPDYPAEAGLLDALDKAARSGFNQYAPMTGYPVLRQAIAKKLSVQPGIEVDADTEITVTAGATQAIFTVLSTVLGPGDQAILFDPSYDCYAPGVTAQGAQAVRIALRAPDFAIDWDEVESRITPNTRLIFINNPNNPSTSVFSAADLDALASLADKYDLIVLSDEVYEHVVFDGRSHHSVLAHPQLRARSFVTYSFGKTFHITGWKLGYCVAPPALTTELRKIHQFLVFSVNSTGQQAVAAHLADASHWQGLPSFFQSRRDRLAAGLQAAGFRTLACHGTYFQLADYSGIRPDLDDVAFARWLTTEYRVASIPISVFYEKPPSEQRIVRFCFAKLETTIDAALERLTALAARSR